MAIEFQGTRIETDDDGYLKDYAMWSPKLAEHMASLDALTLTENHWQVIELLQQHYAKHQASPAVRILIKAMGKHYGKEKGNSRYLYELFPYGPAKQACRYAGLPKPTGCI